MKLVRRTSPYIRKNVSVKRMMLDVVIALFPLVLFALIQNGWNGGQVFLTSILTMIFVEIISVAFMKWPEGMKFTELFSKEGFMRLYHQYNINNILCPVISATIFSLLMPAGVHPYPLIVGSVVGILFGKLVFGAYGNNIFNPAAFGFIFAKLCFGPSIDAALTNQAQILFPTLIQDGVIAGGTPLGQLAGNLGNFNQAMGIYSIKDLFFGNVPGAMGEVCTILILVSFVYLAIRRSIDLRSVLSMVLGFVVTALTVGIVLNVKNGTNILDFILYEVMAGGLLFGAVFMITDPVTSPVTKYGRVFYGLFVGLLVGLIRFIGGMPEGTAFALLIANAVAPTIDYFMRGKPNTYTWKQLTVAFVVVVAVCLIIGFTINSRVEVAPAAQLVLGGLGI